MTWLTNALTAVARGGMMAHAILIFGLLLLCGCSLGPAVADSPFKANNREWHFRAAHTGERAEKNEAMSSGTFELSWYPIDRVAIRGEFPLYRLQENPSSYAAGFNLGFRVHMVEFARGSLFVEGAGGVLYGTKRFPDRGTQFNFTYHFDAGLSLPVFDTTRLELGGRFQHVSNGFIRGRKRNPVSNMFGGFIGIAVPF